MEKKTLKIRSLSLNYILYNFRYVFDIFIPLITFPYVTRVLGSTNLGKVSFAESIIGYFLIFSQLGIPAYATREISRKRDDVYSRSLVFFEMTTSLVITTAISSFIYFLVVFNVDICLKETLLYLVIFPNLIFTNFNYEWFYTGIEDQVYITQRYATIKVLQCISIFVFVHNTNDYIVYAGILVGLNSLSAFFNMLHSRKYIVLTKWEDLKFKCHIKYIFLIFASTVGIQINRVLDITMIGTMINERSVSIYTVANRTVMIIRSLILGIVFTINPRVENLFKKGEYIKYKELVNTSLYLILMLAIPAVVSINVLAYEVIHILAGDEYIDSVLSMRLLSPIILIVGLANVFVSLILFPHRREHNYTVIVIISSLLNCLFNFTMIPKIGCNGAILGTVLAETVTLCLSILFSKDILKGKLLDIKLMEFVKYIIATAFIAIIVFCFKMLIANSILYLLTCVLVCIPTYFILLYYFKSDYLIILKNLIIAKVRN